MRGTSLFVLIFYIIIAKVVLDRWKGANEILKTSFSGGSQVIKTLS